MKKLLATNVEHSFSKPKIIILGDDYFDQVCRLEKACYAFPWTSELIKAEFDKEISLRPAVLCGDRLIGYSFSYLVLDELHILNLTIDPEFRRQGFAKSLLAYLLCLGNKAGVKHVFLEVRVSNVIAQALYESLGFCYQYRRKDYYKNNGEDALVMHKTLSPEEFKLFANLAAQTLNID